MRKLVLFAISLAASGQTTIGVADENGSRVLAGDSTLRALRIVCVNPSTGLAQSCAGTGGGVAGGSVDLSTINGVTISVGAGATDTGTQRVVLGATQPTLNFNLPTGAATSANQTTGNTSLSSIDGKLPALVVGRVPVDGSGVTQPVSIAAAVAVTGTFWQATQPVSLASIPLATNAAQETGGNLAAIATNTGRIPSSPATDRTTAAAPFAFRLTDGTSFYKATTPSDTQPVSIAATVNTSASQNGTWTVQPGNTANTTPWLFSIAQGGNTATVSAGGALKVDGSAATQPVSGTVTVTQGTGTNLHMVCDSGCTPGGSFSDNSVFTFGTTAVNVAGYVLDDISPNAATENNAAAPRMSSNRVPYSIIRDAAGNERGVNVTAGNALTVDGSGVTQPISASSLPLPTGAATGAKQDTGNTSLASIDTKTPSLGQALAAGSVPVVLTAAQLSTLTPLPSVSVSNFPATQPVSGTVAALSSALAKNTQPTATTDGQSTLLLAALDGAQYTRMGGPISWSCSVSAVAASLTQCQAAPGAGLSLYITSLHVQTTTTTSGTYALQSGTGSNCGTGTTALFPSSGTANRFNAPITTSGMNTIYFPVPLKVTANNAVCLIGVATNTISAQIVGFTAP